jgi:hypothetical protein
MKCRFHISHLEVLDRAGWPVRVPWSQVGGGDALTISRAFRREHPGTPSMICVSGRAGRVASRLSRRAQWRELDQPLKFPPAWRVLALFGGLSMTLFLLITSGLWWRPDNKPLIPADEWHAMPPEVRWIFVGVLVCAVFGALVSCTYPLPLVWPYVVFRLRNRNLSAQRVTTRGLVCLGRDETESHFAWSDLLSIEARGKLVFKNQPQRPIRVYVFDNPVWRLVREKLRILHPTACKAPPIKKLLIRTTGTLLAAAIGAELALPWLARTLGSDPPPPGRILAYGAGIGLIIVLQGWLHDRLLKSRSARRSVRRARKSRRGGMLVAAQTMERAGSR